MQWKTRLKAYIDPGQKHNVQAFKLSSCVLEYTRDVVPTIMVTMTDLPELAAGLSSSYVITIPAAIVWTAVQQSIYLQSYIRQLASKRYQLHQQA